LEETLWPPPWPIDIGGDGVDRRYFGHSEH
jgi:hypothetical protein